jgi:hypothetical protein
VDPDSCQFQLDGLPLEGTLTVVATGRAWSERTLVTLPVAGDPAAVCFRPPCASMPASLAVYVADSGGHLASYVSLEWSRETETEGEMGFTTAEGMTLVHGRRAGQPLRLRASADDRVAETTVFLGAGVTDVVLTLPAEPTEAGPSAVAEDDQPGAGKHLVVGVVRRERHARHSHEEAQLPIAGD